MQATMRIKSSKLRQFQELVKRHNFLFQRNPEVLGDWARVSIDGDHLDIKHCNAFFVEWERLNTPIRETRARYMHLLKRRLALRVSELISGVRRLIC